MEAREEQRANALLPMDATESGMVAEAREVQAANAPAQMKTSDFAAAALVRAPGVAAHATPGTAPSTCVPRPPPSHICSLPPHQVFAAAFGIGLYTAHQ